VPTIVVRFFNTVGPRQSGAYGMVLPQFVARALLGRDLIVYGDGTQSRCFCHVGDAVRAVTALLDEPGAVGEAFNVASPTEITILDLARRVLRITGSDSRVRFASHSEGYGDHFEDVPRRVPDISRIQSLVDWRPRWSLDQTIHDVMIAAQNAGPATLLARAA
jgi:UDP-glucose 4-epimerase